MRVALGWRSIVKSSDPLFCDLEPYAAARHLYDLDLLGVTMTRPISRARAASIFDRSGAPALARRVAQRWRADLASLGAVPERAAVVG